MQWALAKRKGEILAWAYDECHLVDRWGSTFRDAYLHVEEACTAVDQQRRQTRRSIRMALTATLTLGQHSRLGALLGMRDFVTVCGGDHARSNLHLAVRHPTARELATSADTDAAVAVLTEVLGGMLPTEALCAGRSFTSVLRGKKRACLQSEGRHPTSTTHIKVLRQRWLLLTKEQRSFVLNSPLVHNQRR